MLEWPPGSIRGASCAVSRCVWSSSPAKPKRDQAARALGPAAISGRRAPLYAPLDVDWARAGLPAKALVRFDEADALLRALLSPLLDAISASDRTVFAALVAAGRAPSPLATR